MLNISVTIITLNEERNIERCLKSVQWADEIIVIDSGSTDKTLEICIRYGCHIVSSEWLGFGCTKQLAVDSAQFDWIFSIDADEEVSFDLAQRLLEIRNSGSDFQGYRINRRSFYLGRLMKHSGWNKDYPLRFFNRQFGRFNEKPVHEGVELRGQAGIIEQILKHYTFPTLSSHIAKIDKYASLGAQEKVEKGKTSNVGRSVLRGILEFVQIYLLKAGFLDGKQGLILAVNSAFAAYMKYLMIWEKKHRPNQLY